VLKKAVTEGVEQLVVFEDVIKFVKRTKLWLPRPPGDADAVLCNLGSTYKHDLTANRRTDSSRPTSKQTEREGVDKGGD
jgi:hypothetical protein